MASIEDIDSKILTGKRTTSPWQVSSEVQEAVNKYISENPDKHKRAQEFGEFLMNHPVFSRLDDFKVSTDDVSGIELKYLEIDKLFRFYGAKPLDLMESEITILKSKLGENWKERLISDYGFTNEDFTA